jgi:HK97 family phage prohead protease
MEEKTPALSNKDKVYKIFSVETKAVDEEAGIYEAWVSTESVDRDGDILLAEGAEVENYSKNPIVLFGHDYRNAGAVVAKTLQIDKLPGQGIKLMFQFLKRGLSQSADLVHDLWRERYLNAMSVGFIPKKWEKRTDENGEELQRGYLFTLWELLEGSIVTVPANQDALRAAYGEKYDEETISKVFDLEEEYTGDEKDPDIDLDTETTGRDDPDPESEEESNTDEETSHDESDLQLEEIKDLLIGIRNKLEELIS